MKPYQIITGIVVFALILLVYTNIVLKQDKETEQEAVQKQKDTDSRIAAVAAQIDNASTGLPGLEEHILAINTMKKDTFESTEEFNQRRDKEIERVQQAAAEGNAAYQAGTLSMREYDADREILTADLVWKKEMLVLLPDLKVAESALMKISRQEAKNNFSRRTNHPFCITVKWKEDSVRFAEIVMAGKNGETWLAVPAIEPEMVAIPGGSLEGGSSWFDEQVTIKPFYIGKYEVTFAEWDACVLAGGCSYFPEDHERGKKAITGFSRNDVQEYIKWLNRVTSREYRLPTRAEWDYAAYAEKKGYSVAGQSETDTAKQENANVWGLHDMKKNADELVAYPKPKQGSRYNLDAKGSNFRLALSKHK